jgi:hypothetical protein
MVHNLMLNNLCGYACVKITLLFPFFSVSFVFLVVLELLMVLFLSRITKKLGLPWRVANVTYVCHAFHAHGVPSLCYCARTSINVRVRVALSCGL